MNKYKIVALFGKSAAGKDTIQRWIVSHIPGTKEIVSCTTRPQRDYEYNGVDYYFLSVEEFTRKVLDGSMLEATDFKDNFYGTPIEALSAEKLNVGVFDPAGIECLISDSRIEVFPIYISALDKTRLLRSLNRESDPDCAEICSRYFTDEEKFENINFEYKIFNNEDNTNLEDLKIFINEIFNQ